MEGSPGFASRTNSRTNWRLQPPPADDPTVQQQLLDLKSWLRETLEHHRNESAENIKAQLGSLQSAMGSGKGVKRLSPETKKNGGAALPSQAKNMSAKCEAKNIDNLDSYDTVVDEAPPTTLGNDDDKLAIASSPTSELRHSPSKLDIQTFSISIDQAASMMTQVDEEAECGHGISEILHHHLTGNELRTQEFDMVMGVFLVLYCMVVFIEMIYAGHQAQVSLGLKSEDGSWKHAEISFKVIEHVVNVVFIIELCIRVYLEGWQRFRKDVQNCFDSFIVATASVHLYILDPMNATPEGNLLLFRILRFGKTARVLRLVSVMQYFTELRILLETIASSVWSLLWSMVFLSILMVISALFLCHSLREVILDEQVEHATRIWLYKHFGDGFRSTYTLFEVTLAGCWPTYFRPLVDKVSGWYIIFVVGYISVVVFAVIRIITALFLKQTLQAASNDVERTMGEMYSTKQKYIKKLRSLFQTVDVSRDGHLSFWEFSVLLENQEVVMWLAILELEIHDAKALYAILDVDGNGSVSYEEFLTGVMRLKGLARNMDVILMMRSLESLAKNLETVKDKVDSIAH